ncbi:MAG: DUF1571 domain-containing protein [Bacteroidia bacterium]
MHTHKMNLTMRIASLFFALLFISLLISGKNARYDSRKAVAILDRMQGAINAVQHMRYRAEAHERLRDGSERFSRIYVKVQAKPYQAYFRTIAPKEGIELLCRPNVDGDKVLINPNGFPWINVKLNIQSKRLREGHHSVDRAGMGYFGKVLAKGIAAARKDGTLETSLRYLGEKMMDNRPCHQVILNDEKYTTETYTVKAGEDLVSIAKARGLNEYKILDLNSGIGYYDDVSEGQSIFLPSSYGKKIILLIDTGNLLPVSIEVHDEKGFFETYSFHDIELNPQMAADEFSPEYSEYGF